MEPYKVKRKDGTLVVVTGKTRSGKTWWTAEQVKTQRVLLVWDPLCEWGQKYNCQPLTTIADLKNCTLRAIENRDIIVSDNLKARFAVQLPTTRANFDLFCRVAFTWITIFEDCGIVVEEIADVSPPGKASLGWGELVRKGLRFGPSIFALTQRPQESDKTMLGMATYYHCHAVNFGPDQEYIAKYLLGVPQDEVAALQPLQWIERHPHSGDLRRGALGNVQPPIGAPPAAGAVVPPVSQNPKPAVKARKAPAAKKSKTARPR